MLIDTRNADDKKRTLQVIGEALIYFEVSISENNIWLVLSGMFCLFAALYTTVRLGSVHYLYPGLVPKRNGLGKTFFWGMKGWVNIF